MTRISQQKCQDIPEYIAIGQKGDIMTEKLKNYKHGLLLLYFPFYLAAFSYLEKRVPDQLHIIDCAIDRYIPFIEVFIIPYLLWFVYIAIAGIYFFFREKESFCKLMYFGMIGMTIFIIVSYVYPNGLELRRTHLQETISLYSLPERSTRWIRRQMYFRAFMCLTRWQCILP